MDATERELTNLLARAMAHEKVSGSCSEVVMKSSFFYDYPASAALLKKHPSDKRKKVADLIGVSLKDLDTFLMVFEAICGKNYHHPLYNEAAIKMKEVLLEQKAHFREFGGDFHKDFWTSLGPQEWE